MNPLANSGVPAHAPITLLVSTRKGAFFLSSNADGASWSINGPVLLGAAVNHMVLDPRDGKTLLMAAHPGHLGPTIYRSTDFGKTWKEASAPPAFPKAENGESVRYTFWLTPGHASEPGVWYAGTCPPALFRTEDGGNTWEGVSGFNAHPMRAEWISMGGGEIPDGNILHSIQIDPRDARHMYFGVSVGGVFETTDQGVTWQPLNQGMVSDFLPDPHAEYGHDPHSLRMSPQNPDLLYQQTHTGIYHMDRKQACWERVGKAMPEDVGDIGFPMVLHPRSPDTAWVFPMDGTEIWPRTSPHGQPAVYRTQDRGKSWVRQDAGFPREHGYFTVKRQAMTSDGRDALGLYLGTTGGQVWGSRDEGQSWEKLADYLPEILAIEAVSMPQ